VLSYEVIKTRKLEITNTWIEKTDHLDISICVLECRTRGRLCQAIIRHSSILVDLYKYKTHTYLHII